jgi:Tfp pilus assembly protein PilN
MRSLHFEFAPRTLRRTLYQTTPLTRLSACLGVALCIGGALTTHKLLAQADAQESALLRLKVKLSDRTASKPVIKESKISDTQAAAVNGAIGKLNLPWRDVLDAVESATPKNIALLALDPDAKRNIVKGMAEAKNSDDMIDYVEQLRKQEFFTSVLLTMHEINEQDQNKPLRFQFEAQWLAVDKR